MLSIQIFLYIEIRIILIKIFWIFLSLKYSYYFINYLHLNYGLYIIEVCMILNLYIPMKNLYFTI